MSFEPTRYCAYGDHRAYAFAFRDDKRSICLDCHAKREREARGPATRERELRRLWRYLLHYAKRRADQKVLPFDLFDHAEEMERRIMAGVCEMTGLPLKMEAGKRDWNSPSIHRMTPKEGYVIGNVRVICFALNAAIGEWGEDRLREVISAWK